MFGRSFDDVEVYTGPEAKAACEELGASAYAEGNRVAFKEESPDRETVAHELTHVVQQTGGVQRKSMTSPSDHVEQEARAVEQAVRGGRPLPEIGAGDRAVARGIFGDTAADYEKKRRETREAQHDESREQHENTFRRMADQGSGDIQQEINDLDQALEDTYQAVKAGFAKQSAGFTTAWNNMQDVFSEISERHQRMAAMLSIFLTFAAGAAGPAVQGLLKKVVGRLGGGLGEAARGAIVEGLTDVMKSAIQAPSGVLVYEGEMPEMGDDYRNPDEFHRNGVAVIEGEKMAAESYITWLSSRRNELEESGFSPADVLRENAGKLAELKAAGQQAMTQVSVQQLEIQLWKSWVEENGSRLVDRGGCIPRMEREFDVPKEIMERLEGDLGVSESRVKAWAGF